MSDGVYDWWSEHTGLLDLFYDVVFLGPRRERTIRRASVAALELAPGDRVLELGCGPGNSLWRLRTAVGPAGRVVALDASAGMVRRARDRVDRAGWANVDVLRGDAASPPVPDDRFDAVYAAMSVTAMPDQRGAIRAARDALRPGGRLAVLDARPFREGALSALDPVVVPVSRRLTNWRPDQDPVGAARDLFEDVSVRSYNRGTLYVLRATAGDRPL